MSLGLCVLAALWAVLRPAKEPKYAGHSLTYWVIAYGAPQSIPRAASQKERAADAIQQIGTNAIPFLLQWICYNPSPGSGEPNPQLNRVLRRISDWLGTEKSWELRNAARERADAAPLAFATLGPRASNAIPRLALLFRGPLEAPGAYPAGKALALIPDLGVTVLAAALTNQAALIRARAACTLYYSGTNAQPLTPTLTKLINDPDDAVCQCAADTLMSIGPDPDVVLPTLINALQQTNPVRRVIAAHALRTLGAGARPAVTPLVTMLSDSNRVAQYEAAWALQEIAPETLTNAAVHAAAVKAFDSPYPHLRTWAAGMMHQFGLGAIDQLTNLMNCLTDDAPAVRAVALITIADLGQNARPAVPAIQRLLTDRVPLVRTRATNALLKIAPSVLTNAPADEPWRPLRPF